MARPGDDPMGPLSAGPAQPTPRDRVTRRGATAGKRLSFNASEDGTLMIMRSGLDSVAVSAKRALAPAIRSPQANHEAMKSNRTPVTDAVSANRWLPPASWSACC